MKLPLAVLCARHWTMVVICGCQNQVFHSIETVFDCIVVFVFNGFCFMYGVFGLSCINGIESKGGVAFVGTCRD